MSKTTPLYRKPMTPGYLGTYNWRSTLLGLLLILTTNIITTQHIARTSITSLPWARLSSRRRPSNLRALQMVCLDTAFRKLAESTHSGAPLVLDSDNGNRVCSRALCRRPAQHSPKQKADENTEDLHGSARWANEEDIRQSGLTDQKHGVISAPGTMKNLIGLNT